MRNILSNVSNWWENHRDTLSIILWNLGDVIDRLGNGVLRMMVIGVIINIITNYFYPEFSSRFPIIYGYCDGFLQLGEFALKAAIGSITSLLTGRFGEFWVAYNTAYKELVAQFISWATAISF